MSLIVAGIGISTVHKDAISPPLTHVVKLSLASVPYTELNLRNRDLILGEVLIENNSFITLPGKGTTVG